MRKAWLELLLQTAVISEALAPRVMETRLTENLSVIPHSGIGAFTREIASCSLSFQRLTLDSACHCLDFGFHSLWSCEEEIIFV